MGKVLSPTEADFWLDTDRYSNYFDNQDSGLAFNIDMIRLSSVRRSIAGFVRILTRENIPVYFNDSGDNVNFDGKMIYLSAKILSKQDFDVAVGQSLHEAAHTLLTNFDAVKMAWTNIPHKIFQASDSKNIRRASLEKFIHGIWNVIEDRYVDNYIFNEAPGYRGYYVALYEKFWHSLKVDAYLMSEKFRWPSLDSYDFRITNFTNENTDLTALPRLDEIADIIDIANIGRLTRTRDRIEKAFEVVEVVLDCLDTQPPPQQGPGQGNSTPKQKLAKAEDFFDFGDDNTPSEKADEPTKSEKSKKPKEGSGESNDEEEQDDEDVDVGKNMVDEIADVMSGRDPTPEKLKENEQVVKKISDEELSKEEEKDIKKMLEHQRKFIQGEIPKEMVTPEQKQLLDLIDKHGIILVRVDGPFVEAGDDTKLKVNCIVVQKMSKELVLSGENIFPLCGAMKFGDTIPKPPDEVAEAVTKGISLGNKLGRRLQVRNEANPVRTVRKRNGKINKRQLHEAAFDAEDLFYKMYIEQHQNATLHITVDASTSMVGPKWNTTMTAVVAICKATSMVDNVHVTVSFRTTQHAGGKSLPYIVLAYDSKHDKFSKVKSLFPYLVPNGATPEGLAFSAIMNLFEGITPDEEERYFLNLSDGEPCFYLPIDGTNHNLYYTGDVGVNHTKAQVEKIRRNGVEILSYFIEENAGVVDKKVKKTDKVEDQLSKNFRKMYGKNAQFIDVNSLLDLTTTINRLFLTKSSQKGLDILSNLF